MAALFPETRRMWWLQACCAVAENADVPVLPQRHKLVGESSSRCTPDECVAAVLGDAERRLCRAGARDGMPRSLGSVHSAWVTLFISGARCQRHMPIPWLYDNDGAIAACVTSDGSRMVTAAHWAGENQDGELDNHDRVHVVDVTGTDLSVVTTIDCAAPDAYPDAFHTVQLSVSSDGLIFLADSDDERDRRAVYVLKPDLTSHDFRSFKDDVEIAGVCADASIVVLAHTDAVTVFRRSDWGAVRSFDLCRCCDLRHRRDGVFDHYGPIPATDVSLTPTFGRVCFLACGQRIAVLDPVNEHIHVCGVDGTFVRHIGAGIVSAPDEYSGGHYTERNLRAIACSAANEIVVGTSSKVIVFNDTGLVLKTLDCHRHGAACVRDIVIRDDRLYIVCDQPLASVWHGGTIRSAYCSVWC